MWLLHRHVDERHDARPSRAAFQVGFVVRDDALLLQPPVAAVALRGRQANGSASSRFEHARAPAEPEDFAVDQIEIRSYKISPLPDQDANHYFAPEGLP